MSTKLFDNSDDSDHDLELKTNENYAKYYKKTRKRELLQKYKDRGLNYAESDESDSDSDSSDDAEEVADPQFDKDFFNTLASLKCKDPKIYDKNTCFFEQAGSTQEAGKNTQKKEKPITLKDYERQVILENNGNFVHDVSDEEQPPLRSYSPTVVQEEQRLKEEFKKIVHSDNSDEEEEAQAFGGIFKKREKTKEERDAEEADYVKWLAGKTQNIQPHEKQTLEPLKKYWNKSNLPRSEQFLRDYILNKGYADTKSSDIPTYEEIVGEETAALSDDEKELEKQAEFEQKYNFRFEEPDTEFIKRYPRTVENSVRRSDDKRKEKRHEIKERKIAEKAQKMKELEIVRELKRKEIEEKLQQLKMVTGNDELGIRDEELDEDFDPEAHDRRMQELFDDNYYAVDEGEEKPECPSDIEELKIDDWDAYDPNAEDNEYNEADDPHCEDEDFNMDCEYDPAAAREQLQQELIENTRGRKGRKARRRDKFMDMIRSDKPRFNPDAEKTYAEYLEEYYKLDCEDIIGDLPCRFKYVETTPNDFGLTIEEILLAKNKELNRWASLKKAIQIRPEAQDKKEARLYKLKAKNEDLKRKIFKSLYGEGSDDDDNDEEFDDQHKDNETATKATTSAAAQAEQEANKDSSVIPPDSTTANTDNKKKKKKKKKRKAQNMNESTDLTPESKKMKLETPNTTTSTVTKQKKTENGKLVSPGTRKPVGRVGNPFNKNAAQKSNNKKFGAGKGQSQKSNYQKLNEQLPVDAERLKAYGINPRKFLKHQKYGNKKS